MKSPLFKKTAKSADKANIRFNKRMITFFICVVVSVFFWLLMSLSKEYIISVAFPVNYIKLPKDKVLSNSLPASIDIEIKSSGFNLLKYKFMQQRDTVLIDIKDARILNSRSHYFLLTNSRLDKITYQLNNDIRVLKIEPDSILLNFNKKTTKKVPVVAKLNLSFESQFQQADSVKLTPSFITISGASDIIEKIRGVETVPVNINNINKSVSVKLAISGTDDVLKFIEYSPKTIQAQINVTKFTEGNLELPIEVDNLPAGFGLKTFPDKITVKYIVAFENYEKINPLQFRAVVDYKKIELGNNKLKVQLVKFPSEIHSLKVSPEKVEYIIRK